jgi:predicted phosphodiesterase
MTYWTNHEITSLSQSLDLSTKNAYLEFCNEFGSSKRTYDSIQKKIKKLRDAYSNEPDEPDELNEENLEEHIQEFFNPAPVLIQKESTEKRKHNKEKARLWLEGLIDLAKSNYTSSNNQPTFQGSDTTMCLVLSDLHFGKYTKWYNLEEANKRLAGIPKYLHSKVNKMTVIDEILIILAGDLVEGEDIYPTQNNHIECSAIEQTQICVQSVWEMILEFTQIFPNTSIRIETVPGNHGRVSKTANEKTNWDNVIYMILDMIAKKHNDDRIVMNCNFDAFRIFKVKDKIGMANHHGVKHTGTSNMREKVAGWITGKQFDFMVHGHWHEWHVGNWLGRFVMANGCMCGPDDLAEQMGKEDTARQGYFFITPGEPIWGFSFVEWVHTQENESFNNRRTACN